MKDLESFIYKDIQKKYFNIYLILSELSKKENIISFTYDKYYLMVRVGVNDYIRVKIEEEVI